MSIPIPIRTPARLLGGLLLVGLILGLPAPRAASAAPEDGDETASGAEVRRLTHALQRLEAALAAARARLARLDADASEAAAVEAAGAVRERQRQMAAARLRLAAALADRAVDQPAGDAFGKRRARSAKADERQSRPRVARRRRPEADGAEAAHLDRLQQENRRLREALKRLGETNRRLQTAMRALQPRVRGVTAERPVDAAPGGDAPVPGGRRRSKADTPRDRGGTMRARGPGRADPRDGPRTDLEARLDRLERQVHALARRVEAEHGRMGRGAARRPARRPAEARHFYAELDFRPRKAPPPPRPPPGMEARGRRAPATDRTMKGIRRLLDEARRRIRELESRR